MKGGNWLMGATLMAADKKRNDRAVKIEADIVRKAQTICAHREITLAEFLSDLLRDPVGREYDKFKRELLDTEKPPKPKR